MFSRSTNHKNLLFIIQNFFPVLHTFQAHKILLARDSLAHTFQISQISLRITKLSEKIRLGNLNAEWIILQKNTAISLLCIRQLCYKSVAGKRNQLLPTDFPFKSKVVAKLLNNDRPNSKASVVLLFCKNSKWQHLLHNNSLFSLLLKKFYSLHKLQKTLLLVRDFYKLIRKSQSICQIHVICTC